jgi:hypothetical protein
LVTLRHETVIVGSSVCGQRWIPAATQFLRRNADGKEQQQGRRYLDGCGCFGRRTIASLQT